MSAVLKPQGDFATQAGHWYKPDGTPCYEIVGANGKVRNTTVRDARKYGLVPSVTTILRQAAAPGLVYWQKEQVAKAAFVERPREGETEGEYLSRVLPLAEEVSAKARERGTAIHGAIERNNIYAAIGRLDESGPYAAHVSAAMDAVTDWAGLQDWSAERSFACEHGYGGKLDLSAPGFVLDFKTTDKPLDGLKTWPEHRRQLAAYRHGLDMPTARCAIVYVQSDEATARVIELDEDELAKGWEEFKALLALWKATNAA